MNLESMKPIEIVDDKAVKEKFVNVYVSIHKKQKKTMEDALAFYTKECIYYKQALTKDPKLASCTNISLFSAFMESAINDLSTQPGAKAEAYYECKGVKSGGTYEKPEYTNTAYFLIQTYGELTLRIRSGQIVHAYNPIVVYEGDLFQPTTNDNGDLIVRYEPKIPRTSKKIIACYVRLALSNNKYDYKWLTVEDIERLKGYSNKSRNNKGANALYASGDDKQIDVGFLETKTIKHAMRSYPKLRVGECSVVEDESEDDLPSFDDGKDVNAPVVSENIVIPKTDEVF